VKCLLLLDMEDTSSRDNRTDQMNSFKKIISDMMSDLIRTFPELENNLDNDLCILWKGLEYDTKIVDISADKIFKYCEGVFPLRFFDILYQNEDMFNNDDNNLMFLPGINYRKLMTENISENTRKTIWKYLQLLLFSTVSNTTNSESFGDTSDIFKAINEDDFKKKLEDTLSGMKDMFNNDPARDSDMKPTDIPSAERLHQHVSGMMEGKLGALAKEIAEETALDLNLDLENATSITDIFSKLMKDPVKLMSMVKNVGTKLDSKIKSGNIKESELLEEASELMKKMKEMPGMENIQEMLSKMGLGGKGKINHSAMKSHMERNIKLAKQKERMQSQVEKNLNTKKTTITQEDFISAEIASDAAKNTLLNELEHIESIFRSGPKAERSSIASGKKKKGKKK
jgi:hypothetical protein